MNLFRQYRSRVAVFKGTAEQRDYALWELTRLETVAKLPGNEGQGMSAREMSFSKDSSVTKKTLPHRTEKKNINDCVIPIHHYSYSSAHDDGGLCVSPFSATHHRWLVMKELCSLPRAPPSSES